MCPICNMPVAKDPMLTPRGDIAHERCLKREGLWEATIRRSQRAVKTEALREANKLTGS
jgi:hypothetical protein